MSIIGVMAQFIEKNAVHRKYGRNTMKDPIKDSREAFFKKKCDMNHFEPIN
ncbi:hypothetical protein ACEZ3G_05755 [Maribacter algicola]|uniref:Uncharacterized protein n=1 Tax=Meishania litoralis TaxID=3434685 RepID=A0ACC7LH17_9FLAO